MKQEEVIIGAKVVAIKMPSRFKQYYSAGAEGIILSTSKNAQGKPMVEVEFSKTNFAYNSIYLKPSILKYI